MTVVRLVARAEAWRAGGDLEDRFGDRWNPRRPIHPEVAPLVEAAAGAVEAAGWWTPGSGEAVVGGLVVGTDVQPLESATRFASLIARSKAVTISPADFLFALPSSAAAQVGVALGLAEYQSTVAMHGLSGIAAVAHAVDQLRLGRLQRVVACAHTFVGPGAWAALFAIGGAPADEQRFQLSCAWCLEAGPGPGPTIEACRIGWGRVAPIPGARTTEGAIEDLPQRYRLLAAPSLLAVGRRLDEDGPDPISMVHLDPVLAGYGAIELRRR